MLKLITAIAAIAVVIGISGPAAANDQGADLRISTGGTNGVYIKVGNLMKNMFETDNFSVEVMTSDGGMDNLGRIARGEADAAIVQADHWALYEHRNSGSLNIMPFSSLYPEYIHVICNADYVEKNDIDDLYDIEDYPETRMAMLSDGSQYTWENIGNEDPDYADIKVVPSSQAGGEIGLLFISQGLNADCGFYVAGIGASLLYTAANQFPNELRLIQADDDGDFDNPRAPDGSRLYQFDHYADHIYDGGDTDFTVSGDYDTISVPAILVFSQDWVSKNPVEFSKMIANRSVLMEAVEELVQD